MAEVQPPMGVRSIVVAGSAQGTTISAVSIVSIRQK